MSVIDALVIGYGRIGDFLQELAYQDVFYYVLPFLLIFGIVYAILARIEIFGENKGVNLVISVSIALLSIVVPGSSGYPFVPEFFREIFPRMGVALAVLIAGLILFGAFVKWEDKGALPWIFFGLGVGAFIIVVLSSFSSYTWLDSWWWYEYSPLIILGIIVIAAIVFIVVTTKGKAKSEGSIRIPVSRR